MEIIFIRHGESEGNTLTDRDEVYTGQWDCPLTERGWAQARAFAGDPMLADADAFFVSDLLRAVETARAMTKRELILDPRLRERSLGEFEGRRVEEVRQDPRYRRYFHDPAYASFRHSFTVRAPNGECYADVCARVRPFLRELAERGYHKVVIVSHFIAIRCLMKELQGLPEAETMALPVPNCRPIRVTWDPPEGGPPSR